VLKARDLVERLRRREPFLFVLTIALHLAPVWSFKYLPTTDGAAHVGNAEVMRTYREPGLSVFRKYYYVSGEPSPNLAGHLILAGLLYVASPTVAEKVVVSLYIVLFAAGARYAVGGIHRRGTPLAYLVFPMTYSFLLHQGFYNFCLSLAGFFFVVGYWVRNRDRMVGWRAVVLCGLGLVVYACHLFSLLMACGVLGAVAGWEWVVEWRRSRRAFGRAAARLLWTMGALAPGMILALVFRPSADPGALPAVEPWSWSHLKDDLISVIQFSTLTSYRNEEHWLGGAVFTVFAALVGLAMIVKIRRRYWNRWDILLLIPAGLLGVYLVKSNDPKAIYFYVPPRALFYAFLVMVLWLAGQPMTRRVRWIVPGISALIAVGFLGSAWLKYWEFGPQIREFVDVAGGQVAPNSTFLPLIFSPQGLDELGQPSSIEVAPFYMISGYIAAQRHAVDLRNYEAKTDHFPVRFREEVNPYKWLAVGQGLDRIPPVIDVEGFRRRGGEIDYVIIWGVPPAMREEPGTVALYHQLKTRGYVQVSLEGTRRVELWKRHPASK
jgi:hypothetical protein